MSHTIRFYMAMWLISDRSLPAMATRMRRICSLILFARAASHSALTCWMFCHFEWPLAFAADVWMNDDGMVYDKRNGTINRSNIFPEFSWIFNSKADEILKIFFIIIVVRSAVTEPLDEPGAVFYITQYTHTMFTANCQYDNSTSDCMCDVCMCVVCCVYVDSHHFRRNTHSACWQYGQPALE